MTTRQVLSEVEAYTFLAPCGIPLVPYQVVSDYQAAQQAAQRFGYPVVLKGVKQQMAHKSEAGIVKTNLATPEQVKKAYEQIQGTNASVPTSVLVQPQIRSERELVCGFLRDPQFGPCVMFGLGGILTEALRDVSFRVAPLEPGDAQQMLGEIKGQALLGPYRGLVAVDKQALGNLLITLGQIGLEDESVMEIDLNPVLLDGESPVAVDALVVLER